jgi:hypothetical protein
MNSLGGKRTARPVEKIYIGVKLIHFNLPWTFARIRPGLPSSQSKICESSQP